MTTTETVKKAVILDWHTGAPEKPGNYLIQFRHTNGKTYMCEAIYSPGIKYGWRIPFTAGGKVAVIAWTELPAGYMTPKERLTDEKH